MKKDSIKNAKNYYGTSRNIELGLKYIENTDFLTVENGTYEIDGSDVYAIVQQYQTKPIEQGKFEAHKKYIDIQYMIEYQEQMGIAHIEDFEPEAPYDGEKDIVFFVENKNAPREFITVKQGEFVIFMPQDAHMPSIAVNQPERVKKVVVKVAVD